MARGLLAVCLCVVLAVAVAQPRPPPGGGGGGNVGDLACSSNYVWFNTPAATSNCNPFSFNNVYDYPDSFVFTNWVEHYECAKSGVRIIRSNGMPDHDIKVANPNKPCEVPWFVQMPLNATYTSRITEVAPLGIIAMSLDGVPQYGALENEGLNAVEPGSSPVQDAQYWYGHAAPSMDWHYHHPYSGQQKRPDESTLVAFALDGFPVYGEVADSSVLDECNGRFVNGQYQYHILPLSEVDENADYCVGTTGAVAWNYMLGCYHGDTTKTSVSSAQETSVPNDCVRVYF